MILKKLAEAFRKQDWVAVLLEIFIVVVGIFIGLQVDDWNEARKAKGEEVAYLERIIEDLDISLRETKDNIEFQTVHAGRAAIVLEALDACNIPAKAQLDFANGIYHLGKISPVEFARMTIDELRSAGRFAILRNVKLRRHISQMVQDHEDHLAFIDDLQGRLAPQINYVDSRVALTIRGPVGGGGEIAWQDVDMDFQSLCKDRQFFNAVSAAVNYTWDVVEANIQLAGEMEALKTRLESELASLRPPDDDA
jgi:hypothetical protein